MRETRTHAYRLVLAMVVGGVCILALSASAVREAYAAIASRPVGPAIERSPLAANGAHILYLPFAFRDYSPFANGGFEDGLRSWATERGPFNGHGSGLAQRVVSFDGGQRALLGQAGNLDPGTIPVGYGTLAQTWTVERRYLSLDYWVISFDNAKTVRGYFDTFEVSINRPPADITEGERDARGCDESARLNPEGTLWVSGAGLVFCGGRPGESAGGVRWDTGGWNTVTLDLSAFQGQNITLYLTLWSREYDAPFYNDRAWFNTWAYVDNLRTRD